LRAARIGEAFAFEAELDMKREQLAEVEAQLASNVGEASAEGDIGGSSRIAA